MNTYEISFLRENNTVLSDRVTAATPGEAKKLFRDIYRHAEGIQGKELKVELVAENTPATKDQEREALAKIKAIVESLGPDSYVGTAFEGCFEIAEDNIGNDLACSMKERVEAVVIENTRLKDKVKELEDKLAESEKDYEAAHADAHEVADMKDAEIAKLKARVQELLTDSKVGCDAIHKWSDQASEQQKRAEAAEAEVIQLKAKLYDYMTAGA